jgi:peptide-methionine (S)-S-oxide reductase
MITAALRALAILSLAAAPARAEVAAQLDTVVFAGGCFWGVQAVFQHTKGVVSATSGYSGGTVANPDYEQVSTGRTGHAEVVRVVYDPSRVSYQQLLTVFFTVAHDPTELNRQGPDVGTQYRSALFYTNEAQRQATQAYIAQLEKSGAVKQKVVTQVAPLHGFTVAEAYHQDYATLHPDQAYIRYNDAPKIAALKQQFPQLWSDKLAAH